MEKVYSVRGSFFEFFYRLQAENEHAILVLQTDFSHCSAVCSGSVGRVLILFRRGTAFRQLHGKKFAPVP
jgi:hypothetical protein